MDEKQPTRRLVLSVPLALGTAALLRPVAGLAQQYDWVNEAPDALEGTWVIRGQRCADDNSQLVIFSSGGYRWRKTRTEWGFARGRYSYNPWGNTVYFRLRRLVQREQPDFQITVSGPEMRRYSYGSGETVFYEKCR